MNGFGGADADIVLVGAGIMSATLATFLKELEPSLRIEVFETLDGAAQESSDAWNNAGTGHAALCELNYTPERPDGTIDISKALEVNVEFDLSRQLWSYLVRKGVMNPASFIHPVPHMSFVQGAANVAFLEKRHAALTAHHLYRGMEFTRDERMLTEWIPLVMEGRPAGQQVAATRMITGADVNYGALTRNLFNHLAGRDGFAIHYRHRATGIRRDGSGWRIDARHTRDGTEKSIAAKFVFLGAGGDAILLLQKSGIPEGKRICRLPGQRHLVALRRPDDQQAPPRQSLHQRCGRFAADVGAASRHARDRRQPFPALRPLCRLLDQVPQVRLLPRSVPLHTAR